MRRIAVVVVFAVLAALAFVQPEPVPSQGPGLGFPVAVDPAGAVGDESVWYCPWVASGAVRDSTYDVATAVNVEAVITLPNVNPILEPDVLQFQLQGADARSVDTAEIVRRGESPGIVEFDDGPAVVTTAMWTESLLSGDQCVVSVPKVWHLVGGTTAEGFTLQLRLFNPFPESAKVTVQAISEFGSSPLGGFEGLDVPGRSWVTEDLSRVIPFLDNVTLTVKSEIGLRLKIATNCSSNGHFWARYLISFESACSWKSGVTMVSELAPSAAIRSTESRYRFRFPIWWATIANPRMGRVESMVRFTASGSSRWAMESARCPHNFGAARARGESRSSATASLVLRLIP